MNVNHRVNRIYPIHEHFLSGYLILSAMPPYNAVKLQMDKSVTIFRTVDKREYLMIIFLFLIKIICCDPSSEPSDQDGSDEGSQCMFLCRINENYP